MKRSHAENISDNAEHQRDRRKCDRVKGKFDLKYVIVSGKNKNVISKTRKAKLEDLSTGGLSFKTKEIVVDGLHISSESTANGPVRNKLLLQFEIPGLSDKIRASCKVIWYELITRLSEPIYAVGVQFQSLQPEYREAIRRHVEGIMTGRAPLRI
jgi:c-di-GMP-binding flagellar brake protein YcgR